MDMLCDKSEGALLFIFWYFHPLGSMDSIDGQSYASVSLHEEVQRAKTLRPIV